MARKKVKLAWIVSDTARKVSMRKRKQGLLKKVRELTILCGVNAFIVIFGYDNERPSVWPSRSTVEQLLELYNEAPENERSKKRTTQESYLKGRIAKIQEQLRKQRKKNQELVADHVMFQLSRGTQIPELKTDDLISLFWTTEDKIKETQKKIEYFNQVPQLPPLPPLAPPRFPAAEAWAAVDPGKQTENQNVFTEMDQWFINMMMNSNDMPGSSSASGLGSNASVSGGLVINGGTELGLTNIGGLDVCNLVEPAMQMNADLFQPQEDSIVNQLGGVVNGGLEGAAAAVGEEFPQPEIENGGDHGAVEFLDEQNHMAFLAEDDESESSLFLQELYDDVNNDGDDLTLPFDFSSIWDNIFSP